MLRKLSSKTNLNESYSFFYFLNYIPRTMAMHVPSYVILKYIQGLLLMAPNLLCWSTWSKADWWYGSRSSAFPPIFCLILLPCNRWQQRGNGIWHWSAYEENGWSWFPLCRKNFTHWYSLTLATCLWRPNRECDHNKAVGGTFQQWQQQHERQVTFHTTIQIFTITACRLLLIACENAKQMVETMLINSVL